MNNWKITLAYALILVIFAHAVAWLTNSSLDHVMIWVLFGAYLSHIESKYAHTENMFRHLREDHGGKQ
ncbi:MAG: hypothetical protein IIZ78_00755 [Clostridiales bacterium]|nr:hypothetical protein [Clostridiales bacterium]